MLPFPSRLSVYQPTCSPQATGHLPLPPISRSHAFPAPGSSHPWLPSIDRTQVTHMRETTALYHSFGALSVLPRAPVIAARLSLTPQLPLAPHQVPPDLPAAAVLPAAVPAAMPSHAAPSLVAHAQAAMGTCALCCILTMLVPQATLQGCPLSQLSHPSA